MLAMWLLVAGACSAAVYNAGWHVGYWCHCLHSSQWHNAVWWRQQDPAIPADFACKIQLWWRGQAELI